MRVNKLLLTSLIAYVITYLNRPSVEFAVVGLLWLAFGAWIQHIVKTIEANEMALLVIGAVLFPIGVIHGGMIWIKDLQSRA
jgi:hypothetical protein